jgi:hypothetical protein
MFIWLSSADLSMTGLGSSCPVKKRRLALGLRAQMAKDGDLNANL